MKLFILLIACGLSLVACVAERTPPPKVPTFATEQGKANARQCQQTHNQCTSTGFRHDFEFLI